MVAVAEPRQTPWREQAMMTEDTVERSERVWVLILVCAVKAAAIILDP